MTKVKVVVRVKPILSNEDHKQIISVFNSSNTLSLDNTKEYKFDHVFHTQSTQDEVYDVCINNKGMLKEFLRGVNCSILAYGQTGSGKTYTMGTAINECGIIQKFIRNLFLELHNQEFELRASFVELYNEELKDLLNPSSVVTIREDSNGNVQLYGIQERICRNEVELMECLSVGTLKRSTASTDMNLVSSRSHGIFIISLERKAQPEDNDDASQKSSSAVEASSRDDAPSLISKFYFVDLAGSERIKKTKSTGDRMKEGIAINSGLLAMGKVIYALNDSSTGHIPYRDSKLTRILQDSLGGNSNTLMIACVSSSIDSFGETMSTLNYASRAMNIKNYGIVNVVKKDNVAQLQREIERLKRELMKVSELEMERDSLLFELQQLKGTSGAPTMEINPIIQKYKSQVSELENRLKQYSSSSLVVKPTSAVIEKAKVEIQRDQEYIEKLNDGEPATLDADSTDLLLISKLSSDIVIKEELVSNLERSQKEYQVMKESYESKLKQLQDNLEKVEKDRDAVVKSSSSTSNNKEAIQSAEAKVQKLNSEILNTKKRYQQELKEQQEKRIKYEVLLSKMKQNLEDLKEEKSRLIRKVKDKESVIKKEHDDKVKIQETSKRKEREYSDKLKKMEQEQKKTQFMLKRRTEESLQAKSKLKNVMSILKSKTTAAATTPTKLMKKMIKRSFNDISKRPKTTGSIKNRTEVVVGFKKNILNNMISGMVKQKQNNEVLDQLFSKRLELMNEMESLNAEKENLIRSQNEDDDIEDALYELDNRTFILEAEINYYNARISSIQLEQQQNSAPTSPISNSSLPFELKSHDELMHSCVELLKSLDLNESHCLLQMFLNDYVELSVKHAKAEQELDKSQKELKDTLKTLDLMKSVNVSSFLGDDFADLDHALDSPPKGDDKRNGTGNIFERLHREQTIASQAKMKDNVGLHRTKSDENIPSSTNTEAFISEKALEKLSKLKISLQKAIQNNESVQDFSDKHDELSK